MSNSLIEETPLPEGFFEDKDSLEISKFLARSPKINLGNDLNLYFDQELTCISLSPIFPIAKVEILFQLYKLCISREEIVNKIKKLLNGDSSKTVQTYLQNGKKIQKTNTQTKIIDDHFIRDCIILSKASDEGAFIIADRISKTLFGESIIYKYKSLDENKKYVIAYLKFKDNIFVQSDFEGSSREAKLNVNKKIIIKYLPKETSTEIIENIKNYLENKEKIKNEKRARFEKLLQEIGGDRNMLKNKRKLSQEEFSLRLPYFNMLEKDKNNKNNNSNNLIEEDEEESEEYFMNTESFPINEILLGDSNIVEHHLKDFKYTPLRLYEMIRDSEKRRGVDFRMDYSQVNDKNYCINNESTIFSQKLGIKVQGFGRTKEEAENKCALKLLSVIFKNKFKTYFELHNYFENKNGKYLDIILVCENSDKNKNKSNVEKNELFTINNIKRKKVEEIKVNAVDNNSDDESNINNFNENIQMNGCMQIPFKNKNSSFENNTEKSTNNCFAETCDTFDNFNSNPNNNYNFRIGFGNLFQCNSYNNENGANTNHKFSLNNSIRDDKLIEELKN